MLYVGYLSRCAALFLFIGSTLFCTAQNSVSEIAAVQLSAVAQTSPVRITLSWPAFTGATGYTIYRKLHTGTSWGASIGTATGSSTTYADNTAALNTEYEYKVVRAASSGTGYGYLCSGIELAPIDYRGKIILLVDNAQAAGIAASLTQLQSDLSADGWVVIRHDIATGTTVSAVRNLVIADRNADPTNVKMVYVVGHVPVPYSGNISPDGHEEQHKGAWPCDGYYGEMNGTWTDNSVNNTTGWDDNKNVPGDGKFDQDSFSNAVELQVGRVDLHELPAFSSTETQLLNTYFAKAHAFRTKAFTPQNRAIMRDHLEDVTTPLAYSGWASMATMVGAANITEVPYSSSTWLQDQINGQSYLWAYGSGGGLIGNDNGVLMFNSTDMVATTVGLTTTAWGAVFNMTMCSYIGDWNNRNNVMRARLCSGDALGIVYSGSPNWFFHPMGMGETIGHCTQLTMNNTTLYTPQSGSEYNPAPRSALGFMGDPALRMLYVAMPSNLSVSNSGGNAAFSWTAAPGSPAGYYIYKLDASGVPTRVNTTLVTGTTYTSAQAFQAGSQYMVRAAKLETTSSGTWWNLSLGALATATTSVQAAVRVVLEGPYDAASGLMRDDLRTAGSIPLTEPYTALGYAQLAGGGGETMGPTVLNTTGNNAIVDWVRVELRSSTAPATVLATKQGLLQRDGDVVSIDGTSPLTFAVGSNNYFVAVRHRNHLGAMTAGAVALNGTATVVNFKDAAQSTYGTNAMTSIAGTPALWMGNTNGDTSLKYAGASNDRDPILVRIGGTLPTASASGYYLEDCDMNGVVRYTGSSNDRDPILVNIGSGTPTNTRTEQLP